MHRQSYYIINGITLYRILTAPLLIYLIFTDRIDLFKWLLAASFFSDMIDGVLARRYKVKSLLGSRLDSIGDDLTVLVGIIGLFRLKYDFISQHFLIIGISLGLFLLQLALALWKYHKPTVFHNRLAKLGALFQGIFLITSFFLPEPNSVLFYIAMIVTLLDLIEEIILVLMLPKWQSDVKGIWWIRKERMGRQEAF
jgi:phosphatidylglycerophosphate synthase